MKKTLLILIALVLAAPCYGQDFVYFKKKAVAAAPPASGCDGYLICEDFETATTGYDDPAATWTEVEPANSVVNPAYATAPLAGSQSLLLDINEYSLTVGVWASFTAQDTVYAYTMFRTNYDVGQDVILLQDSSGNALCRAYRTSGDVLKAWSSGSSPDTVATMAINTTYHVWMRYTKGTGSNAVCSVAFSTDGTEPTSGNNFASCTDGTETAQAARVYLGGAGSDNTLEKKLDKVRVKTTAIGSNPS